MNIHTDIEEGIDLFNSHNYFEAHDYFEDKWIDADRADRLFFQGLVQVSVGCFHLISGNHHGAGNQFTKAKEKLLHYNPSYFGVNILNLINDVDEILEKLISGVQLTPEVIAKMKLPKITISNN